MGSDSSSPWPTPAFAPLEEDLARCVHCGLCLPSCPTYLVTAKEAESPRGRIALARAVAAGELPLTAAVAAHWERCLECRACEAACPSGVPYGRIIERLRAQGSPARGSRLRRALRRATLRHVVGRPRVLRLAGRLLRAYARAPLRPALRLAARAVRAHRLARLDAQLPDRPAEPLRPRPAPPGAGPVAILPLGCVMNELLADVHLAAIRVLEAAGWRVATVEGCCGALHLHDGDPEAARRLARALIGRCEREPDAVIVLDSAGCGAAMKEYPHLFQPGTRWYSRAQAVAARVRDFSEVVPPETLAGSTLRLRATYQDPCHLAHAQRIREQPRRLLQAIAGLQLAETAGADICCGAAGIYGLLQPELSSELISRKERAVAGAAVEAIVTANPGCHLQFLGMVRERGLRTEVLHLAEVLDRALANR
ncbi:Lactate utilization protein A [bacterium HR29]|nr:Lactate utilization protein A [bacterium HR29]